MQEKFDVLLIGSGMSSLANACLLSNYGLKVAILEQNYLAGGCTSSYWRKGFVFESGATTLVGLDQNMPLKYLLDQIQVQIPIIKLNLPMQVYLKNGKIINRYQDLNAWILEAERVFGTKNQAQFWKFCYKISQFVWKTSLKQTAFPPSSFSDLWQCVKNSSFEQFRFAPYAMFSMKYLLKKFDLLDNQDFVDFVNQQLLITAQNHLEEVNVLFGATALCYTNYGNHYVEGGLINLVNPLIQFLEKNGSKLFLRHKVMKINDLGKNYELICETKNKEKTSFIAKYLVSGLPINNTLPLFDDPKLNKKFEAKVLKSKQLNGCFQMGIGFESDKKFSSIHHQILLQKPLPDLPAKSIFVSLNHESDLSRCDQKGCRVASVSTHIPDPAHFRDFNKEKIENAIIENLENLGFLEKQKIVYQHSSAPAAWEKWTNRKFGFVGGYPQYMDIKVWQMLDARLDGKRAYLCGDTAYPGQGIVGVTLSGIIAFEKMKRDWF